MRYLLIILILLSFSFSQLLPSDEDIAKMSSFEKQMLYDKNDKSSILAIVANSIPTLGYAYIDDWERGLYFKGAEIGFMLIGHYFYINRSEYIEDYYDENGSYVDSRYKKNNLNLTLGLIGYGIGYGLAVYETIDLYKQTKKYNERLHNKIFGKKDNNLSFLILPTSNGAYLNLSYKF